AMMARPEEALPRTAAVCAIVDFLTPESRVARTVLTTRPAAQPATTVIEGGSANVIETTYTVGRPAASMFGILSEPDPNAPRAECCVLFLNPGAVRHIGPNRMWVEAARRWAAR